MTSRKQAPDLEAQRDALIEAALPHVPFDGWTMTALERGAVDLGLTSQDAHRLFPGSAIDMIDRMNRIADSRMLEAWEALDRTGMRTPERITTLVMLRFDWALPYREAVRRGLSQLALPMHAPAGARMLYRTVDAIWKAAGDRSTDYNFYTKRGLLAAVLTSTLLYWLDDHSADSIETKAFLERRLKDVTVLPQVTGRMKAMIDRLPSPSRLLRARRMNAPFRG